MIILPERAKMLSVWIPFLIENRFNPEINYGATIEVNFNSMGFIEPYHISSLACLIEEYWSNNIDIVFTECTNNKTCRYLDQIGFFKYWVRGETRNSAPSKKQTTLPLTKISRASITQHVQIAYEYFQNNFLDTKDLMPISISLTEVFNNICDHSESPVSGFSITQYYPQKQEIIISVCDFGKGIPNSINQYLTNSNLENLSDINALEKSIERKFTIKSMPNNGGLGLDNIRCCALDCGGSMSIISNTAILKIDSENTFKLNELENSFDGTLIKIVLDTDRLEEKEDTFEYDFNF